MNPIAVTFDNERITLHGGFEIIDRFANNCLELYSLLKEHIKIFKRKSKYSISQLTYALISANIIFPFRISQLDYLKNDDFLKDKFDVEEHPDSDTYRLHLLKFTRKNLVQIKRIIKALLQHRLIIKVLKELEKITIDVDSSLFEVYGEQEGAAPSYLSKKTKKKYLNALFGFIFELNLMVNLVLRSGNRYTSKSAVHFLRQILLIIPSQFHYKIVIRADSGFFDEKVLEFLEKYHIQYLIKAKSYGSFEELIRRINHQKFAPKGERTQYAKAEFKLHSWKKPRKFLIIKKKMTVDNLKEVQNNSQFQLPFQISDYYYEYSFIVCTNSNFKNMKLYKYYCQRGNSENFIKEFKNGFGASAIASSPLTANYANFLLKAISYNVFSIFKRFVLQDRFANKTISTIRYFIIYIPGKLVTRGRKVYLSLINNYRFIDLFMGWQEKIVVL
jgi:hypothetical protein